MRVEYQLTFEEYKEGSRGEDRRIRRVIFYMIAFAALSAGGSWLWTQRASSATTNSALNDLLPWIGVFLVIWLIIFTSMRAGAAGEWQRQHTLRLPKTVELLPDRIYLVDTATRSEYLWGMIEKVIETPNTFAFKADGRSLFIVPKRALGLEQNIDAFRSAIFQAIGERSQRS